jgi:hypothetical protein
MNKRIPQHMQKLLKNKTERAADTRQEILNVLRHAAEPLAPHEIESLLRQAKTKLNFNEVVSSVYTTIMELEDMTKNNKPVVRRTIHTHLKKLVKEGLVKKKDGKYSLTVAAKSDIRYFARKFGNSILWALMSTYVPTNYTKEQNVRKLVELFGILILFCMIETARPIDDTAATISNAGKKSIRGRKYKEDLASSCLQNIIRTDLMYYHFLAILGCVFINNTRDNDNHSTNNNSRNKIAAKDNSAFGLFSALREREANIRRDHESYGISKPILELDDDILARFSDAFRKVYPSLFEIMSEVKDSALKGNPKQKIEDIRDGWPPLII